MKKQFSPASLMISAIFVVSLGCSTFLLSQNHQLRSTNIGYENQLQDVNPNVLPDIDMIDLIVDKLIDSATRRLSKR